MSNRPSDASTTSAAICWVTRLVGIGGASALLPSHTAASVDLGGLVRRGRANRNARRPPLRADHCSCEWGASVLRYLPGPCTSVEKPAAAQRVHRCDLLKGRLIDLRRQRELHSLQNYGLRRSVPGGLLLRGREYARHPPGRMH